MSYIGQQPTVGNFQICDAISVVNGQAAYTMQVASVNVVPETEWVLVKLAVKLPVKSVSSEEDTIAVPFLYILNICLYPWLAA